jgi:hypothetical protein
MTYSDCLIDANVALKEDHLFDGKYLCEALSLETYIVSPFWIRRSWMMTDQHFLILMRVRFRP